MKRIGILGGTLFLTPMVVLAQDLSEINQIVTAIQGIVNILIPVAFGLIVVAFFWGLATYIFSAGDEEAKARGRSIMIGGVIALFIAASIWGIIAFIGDQIGVEESVGGDTVGGPDIRI